LKPDQKPRSGWLTAAFPAPGDIQAQLEDLQDSLRAQGPAGTRQRGRMWLHVPRGKALKSQVGRGSGGSCTLQQVKQGRRDYRERRRKAH
jgi:hypothetical protein